MSRRPDVAEFANTLAEIHALIVGAIFGLLTGLLLAPEIAAFFALVIMGVQVRHVPGGVDRGHLRDAAKEVAYSGGAFVVTFPAGLAVNAVAM